LKYLKGEEMVYIRLIICCIIFSAVFCVLLLITPLARAEDKAFIFLDPVFGNFRYKTLDVEQMVDDIKNIGVTDIIVEDSLSGTVAWESLLPGVIKDRNLSGKSNKQFLDRLVTQATKNDIGIWLVMHITGGKRIADTPAVLSANNYLFAHDFNGEIYMPPHYDVFNPAVKAHWYSVIDEIQQKYGTQIKGFVWDETWHNESDLYGDNVREFQDFCLREFGETIGAEQIDSLIKERYGQFLQDDVWWRRYALFRQEALASYIESLNKYAKAKGYSVINEPMNSAAFNHGWKLVSIPHKLASSGNSGDYNITAAQRIPSEIYNNGIMNIYPANSKYSWGNICSGAFQGSVPCMFTYEWIPFQDGNVLDRYRPIQMSELPENVRERYKEFLDISKEWIGAERLATYGIMTCQNGVTLRFENGLNVMKSNEMKLMNTIQDYANVVLLHLEDSAYWTKYPLLILPTTCVQYMPETSLKDLIDSVTDGHFLVAFTSQWSTANEDLSNKKDIGESFLGLQEIATITPNFVTFTGSLSSFHEKLSLPKGLTAAKIKRLKDTVQTLAVFEDNSPAITFSPIGKGGIILFHFDLLNALDEKVFAKIFVDLLTRFSGPAIASDGALKIRSVLKHDDKIMVSLYQKYDELPVKGIIRIHPNLLGWQTNEYNVTSHICKNDGATRSIRIDQLAGGIEVSLDKDSQYELMEIAPKQ
jgi:hypothetical protein